MTVAEILEEMDNLECDIGGDVNAYFFDLEQLQVKLEAAIKAETVTFADYSLNGVSEKLYNAKYGDF